jgi:type I restriction enzyme S subunit
MILAEQLRKAVLQAAVQGKLTKQIYEDENTTELLTLINSKKMELIKNKIISKDKNIKHILSDDIPFDIPDNWRWVRFGEIVHYNMGKTPPRSEDKYWSKDGYPWVSISDMVADGYIEKTKEYVSDIANQEKFKRRISKKGTLLMSFKLTIGKVSILSIDAYHNEAIISIYPFEETNVLRDFLFKTLPFISNWGKTKSAIKGKTLNSKSISNLLVPLPPLAEQERIVIKLEKILPMIDALEKDENKLKEVVSQFPDKVKASILQAAIQGKLTNQLQDEKVGLDKKYFEQNIENLPYDLPKSWVLTRLQNVATLDGGFAFKSSNYQTKGTRVLRISDFNEDGLVNNKIVYYKYEDALSKYLIKKEDIVLCMTGGTVGKNYYFSSLDDQLLLNQRVARISAKDDYILSKYLSFIIKSPLIQKEIGKIKNSTNDNISMKNIKNFLIPLPPLTEQERIVNKLDQILPLVKSLSEE